MSDPPDRDDAPPTGNLPIGRADAAATEPTGSMADGIDPEAAGAETIRPSKRSFRNALSWSYVLTGGRVIVTMLVSLVLARLLGPEAFGVIAMANVYIFFVEMVVRQGLVAAVIQRPDLSRAHLDAAFWMTVAAVSLLTPLSLGLSGWWADMNDTPALQPVIIGMTPLLLLKGLSVVQEAQLRRSLHFRPLAIRTNAAVLAGAVVGIGLAFAGAGVWALVAQQLTTGAVELVVLWSISEWRPRFRFDRDCAKDLLGFSGKTAVASFGAFANQRSDALIIGLMFGAVVVGLYRLAQRFVDLVVDISIGALQGVSLPELSRFATDQEAFNRRAVEIMRLSTILSVPLFAGLAVVAGPLTDVLGEDWSGAKVPLQVLAIVGATQSIGRVSGPLLQAADRAGLLAILTWVTAGLSATAFVGAGLLLGGAPVDTQVAGLAASRVALLAPTLLLILLPVLQKVLGLRVRAVLRACAPTVVASALGWVVATLVLELLFARTSLGAFIRLAIALPLGGAVIYGLVLLLEPYSRRTLVRLYRRLRRSSAERPDPSSRDVAEVSRRSTTPSD